MDDGGHASVIDPGAGAFAFLLQLLGLPANASEILHQSGKVSLDETDLLRAARNYPIKARAIASTLERLERAGLGNLGRGISGVSA